MNSVNLIGRNVRDVELKHTQGGMAISTFTIAVDRGLSKDKKQEAITQGNPVADFLKVVCFNHTAEFVAKYLAKGKLVSVEGKIQTGSYTNKENQKIYTTDIMANNVQVLEWENKEASQIEGFNDVDSSDMGDIPF